MALNKPTWELYPTGIFRHLSYNFGATQIKKFTVLQCKCEALLFVTNMVCGQVDVDIKNYKKKTNRREWSQDHYDQPILISPLLFVTNMVCGQVDVDIKNYKKKTNRREWSQDHYDQPILISLPPHITDRMQLLDVAFY
ncbi:hypothetical protein QE152_g25462 [Popillia japonica]|uniref:Uncharacterized protein n=1 Tax=Popillia japonica TaxID=7064 RepID=A0AAW1K1L3_POPJA